MKISTKKNPQIVTKNSQGSENGFLVPIYNRYDGFIAPGKEPQQVYLTMIAPHQVKGPHLHFIRTGYFTCIKGNTRFVLQVEGKYKVFYSGEQHEYLSVIVPTGVPAALQNIGSEEAFVLNMPNPAWTPEMEDEHTADFSDFDFTLPSYK